MLASSAVALLDTECLLGWAHFVAAPLTGDYLEWNYFKILFNCVAIQLIIWNTYFHSHHILHNYSWTLCLLSWLLFLYFRSSYAATSTNLLKIKKINWSQEESLSNLLKFLELIKKNLADTQLFKMKFFFPMNLTCDWAHWQPKLHRDRRCREGGVGEPHIHPLPTGGR